MADEFPALPATFARTREAMHALAEHVISAARFRATGRIGLRATLGGFGTPPFGENEQVRVDGTEIVHRRGEAERRAPITTLAAAATFVDVPLGAPPVYTAVTHAAPDEPLAVDAGAATVLAQWYAFADARLETLRRRRADAEPSDVQLWPEHFDLATDLGDADAGTRANYGASPGDGGLDAPYMYVGPWESARRTGAFGAHPFGAALPYDELRGADPSAAADDFFESCANLLLGDPR